MADGAGLGEAFRNTFLGSKSHSSPFLFGFLVSFIGPVLEFSQSPGGGRSSSSWFACLEAFDQSLTSKNYPRLYQAHFESKH